MDEFLTRAYEVVLRPAISLLFAAAFLIFIWGLVKFMKDKDSDEGRATGWRNIGYGILGMVIMISVFGIINIILGTLGERSPVDQGALQQDLNQVDVKDDL